MAGKLEVIKIDLALHVVNPTLTNIPFQPLDLDAQVAFMGKKTFKRVICFIHLPCSYVEL